MSERIEDPFALTGSVLERRFHVDRVVARLTDRARLVRLALGGLGLWAGLLGLLALVFGGTLVEMGAFFTKAALLTFGGAYAVLPYVYQGAVEHYHWLSGPQMIDGLALGETTPGPLIMVVAFVGYVGAWTKQVFGPDALAAAGALGAVVATWFTFLPSFLFILIGGPYVEATRGDLKFTAPLTGITAAVVGVILSLALFFAQHVLWPSGFGGPFEALDALADGGWRHAERTGGGGVAAERPGPRERKQSRQALKGDLFLHGITEANVSLIINLHSAPYLPSRDTLAGGCDE